MGFGVRGEPAPAQPVSQVLNVKVMSLSLVKH
jgi:hypothetical protein